MLIYNKSIYYLKAEAKLKAQLIKSIYISACFVTEVMVESTDNRFCTKLIYYNILFFKYSSGGISIISFVKGIFIR